MVARLSGCRIVVPESRALDLFVDMLEREGAVAIRCPLVAIHDVADAAPVEAWLGRFAAGHHDDLVLFTGEGLSRLLGFAERAGIRDKVLDALRRVRTIVRGPKPTRVLRTLGMAPDIAAEEPTSDGLVVALSKLDMNGRAVGVQLYPGAPPTLVDFLTKASAKPDPVLCYAYASRAEDSRVEEVIRAIVGRQVDIVAFTSSPQVKRLKQVAAKSGQEAALREAFTHVQVAAVGPVTAEAVTVAGWSTAIAPDANFHLKPFIERIAASLNERQAAAPD
jgi:uroporphyrinogen-III synthase